MSAPNDINYYTERTHHHVEYHVGNNDRLDERVEDEQRERLVFCPFVLFVCLSFFGLAVFPAEKINEKNENTSAADLLRARENHRDFLVFFFHFFFGEKRRKRQ